MEVLLEHRNRGNRRFKRILADGREYWVYESVPRVVEVDVDRHGSMDEFIKYVEANF